MLDLVGVLLTGPPRGPSPFLFGKPSPTTLPLVILA